MEEDDSDFTPTPNTSSNLASLFGYSKKPLQGNPSLTYTAPKAPKSPAKQSSEEKPKAITIFSRAVKSFKLENGNYVSQGVTGVLISGNHDSHIYELILYKANKDYLSRSRIFTNFSITLSANNYASFYDSNQQNWSMWFPSSEDIEQFVLKIAICKFYCQVQVPNIIMQDLTPMSLAKANPQSTVEVTYNAYALNYEEIVEIKKDVKEKIKLSNYHFTTLSNRLIGCCENSKRALIIPYSECGHWSNLIKKDVNLLLVITVEKLLADSNLESKPNILEDWRESPIDSSEEETIKTRGAMVQEALANTKSHKANLISRMARIGQISLPVKPNLSTGPSDSEEEGPLTTSSPKPRTARSRLTAVQQSDSLQQVSVYHNDLTHHPRINQMGVAYQQLIPVSSSPVISPSTDPNFSAYVSESRAQAVELRMGISKISEKLDLVWNKIQNMSGKEFETLTKTTMLDSGGVLSSIQNLITENERLKVKVEEQKEKIEQQNDKIFQLLDLNHKYLEQSASSQSGNESKLRAEVELLRSKEIESKEAFERVKLLEGSLRNADTANKDLKRKLKESEEEVAQIRKNFREEEKIKELESLKEKLSKASDIIIKLKEKLRLETAENERLNHVIKTQKMVNDSGGQEVKDSKVGEEKYESTVEKPKTQIPGEGQKAESRRESLRDSTSSEDENKNLKKEMEKARQQCYKKLEEILVTLQEKFPNKKQYSSAEILTTVESAFHAAMNDSLNSGNLQGGASEETPLASVSSASPAEPFLNKKPQSDKSVTGLEWLEEQHDNRKVENSSQETAQKMKENKAGSSAFFLNEDDDDF